MAVESAGCPYVKVPVPIQDTYSVAEIAMAGRTGTRGCLRVTRT